MHIAQTEAPSAQKNPLQQSDSTVEEREQPLSIFDFSQKNYLQLPRLPIPDLADTIETLLASCRVHDAGEPYQNLVAKANAFLHSTGKELQAQLRVMDQNEGYPFNYVQAIWDDLYLENRLSHPINTAPFFQLNADRVSGETLTARFVANIVRWTLDLREGQLSVKGGLCNSAMGKQFATAKIPKSKRDEIIQCDDSNNIILLCNGNIVSLPVVVDKKVVDPKVIEEAMDYVANLPKDEHAISSLTATSRDIWANERTRLIDHNKENAALLSKIDNAIVVLSIDTTVDSSSHDQASQALLAGDITSRWFDKHQIILLKHSGRVGINFEHSCSDGTNWIHFIQDCLPSAEPEHTHHNEHSIALNRNEYERIQFEMPTKTKQVIAEQAFLWQQQLSDVDTHVLTYTLWGKSLAKEHGVSPDAMVQMAFQLAYFRLKGDMAPTYESAQMRQYFCARTDTIRSCSSASKRFAFDWQETIGSKSTLLEAIKSHKEQSKRVLQGEGIDRHLLSLETLAKQQGYQEPLFSDPLYKQSATWLMSTSNGSDPSLDIFGFGPVTHKGFGLGYIIKPNSLCVNITAFKSAGNAATDFSQALEKVLDEFYQLLTESASLPHDTIYP